MNSDVDITYDAIHVGATFLSQFSLAIYIALSGLRYVANVYMLFESCNVQF